jgi:UV DNA damage endonuclease
MLIFNKKNNILFFRISSDIIPFASHPILNVDWKVNFKDILYKIGKFIKKSDMRISMHPDQFIVLNSQKNDVVQRSIQELSYHAAFLDALGLDSSAKIQLHVGGVYGNKRESVKRFMKNYSLLSDDIKKRLVIENDERSYNVVDCLQINTKINIPVLLDVFHHQIFNHNESINDILNQIAVTWSKGDGIPMIDYSSQEKNEKIGKHATHLNATDFTSFLHDIKMIDVDVMLEIKDKEKSALKAISIAKTDPRFIQCH